MSRRPRRSPLVVLALFAACGDDEPTGPTVEDVTGFGITVSHVFGHHLEGGVNVQGFLRIDAPDGVTLEELAGIRTVQVDVPGLSSQFADNSFDEMEGEIFMTVQAPTRPQPLPSGTYAALMRFSDRDHQWRFTSEVVSDPIPAPAVEGMAVTDDEAVFTWVPPEAPHRWKIDLYAVERDGTNVTRTLVSSGTPVDGEPGGDTVTASTSIQEIEPGALFEAELVVTGEATVHIFAVEEMRPVG